MKPLLFSSVTLLALAAAGAQTFTPKNGGKTPARAAAAKDAVVDISDSAIAKDFGIKDAPAPPELEEALAPSASPDKPQPSAEPETAPASEPEGVSVRVEPGKSGIPVDSSKVKLLAPFPAKALAKAPTGWQLQRPDHVPALTKEVTLDNGTRLNLSIRPHVLVPVADGSQVIGVSEPGYDPTLQYAQEKTMGAILSSSLDRMDQDSKNLGDALERLQQLLGSLPHPAPPTPPTKSNSPR